MRRPGSSGAPHMLSTTLTADWRDSMQAACMCSIAVANKPGCTDACHSAADLPRQLLPLLQMARHSSGQM